MKQDYTALINNALHNADFGQRPPELYEPIRYILSLGGKRLRPTLTLLAYGLFKGREHVAEVLNPALAVEVFHNFTLMHDDIMDEAPIRRGKPSVHYQWNQNIAILSGDVMMVRAYDLLLDIPDLYLRSVLQAFNQCAAEVCEGQQYDMIFETRSTVSQEEYLEMIRLKTAVLLGFSLKLGAMLAGASAEDCQNLYEFGQNVGIGFQLKDDLLDVYAEQSKFGKQVGGDIIANKKTFLLIKAIEVASPEQYQSLQYWLDAKDFDKQEKVNAVKTIYDDLDIRKLTEDKMNEYFAKGFTCLDKLGVQEERVGEIKAFTEQLIAREK